MPFCVLLHHNEERSYKKVSEAKQRSNAKERSESYRSLVKGEIEFSTRFLLIQQLITLGLLRHVPRFELIAGVGE